MKYQILLSFTFCNHLGQNSDHVQTFYSFPHFKQYLRWVPDKGMKLGYFRPDAETLRLSHSSNIKLSIQCGDEVFQFDNARDVEQFLASRQDAAKRLQFHHR